MTQRACPPHPAPPTTSDATSCRCPDPEANGRGSAKELAQVSRFWRECPSGSSGPDRTLVPVSSSLPASQRCLRLPVTCVTFDDLTLLKRSDCLFSRMFLSLGLFVTFPMGVGLGTRAVVPQEWPRVLHSTSYRGAHGLSVLIVGDLDLDPLPEVSTAESLL